MVDIFTSVIYNQQHCFFFSGVLHCSRVALYSKINKVQVQHIVSINSGKAIYHIGSSCFSLVSYIYNSKTILYIFSYVFDIFCQELSPFSHKMCLYFILAFYPVLIFSINLLYCNRIKPRYTQ